MTAMSATAFSAPLFIRGAQATPLTRVRYDDAFQDEDWLQELLFKHKQLIPFDEISAAFNGSVPVAREVESGVGPIDLLYANPDGMLTLIETKLWRNPESRRKVVAQVIDYAAALTRMTYEQLSDAVKRSSGTSIGERVRALAQPFDERRFHDAVSRNLKRGSFLLLVAGDEIREDLEAMSDYLRMQPQLHFTLALVEMAIFQMNAGSNELVFVQPRVVARTREIVRAVIEVKDGKLSISTPAEPAQSENRSMIDEDQFLGRLSALKQPETVELAKWVFAHAAEHKLKIKWGRRTAGLFYIEPANGHAFKFGHLNADGTFRHILLPEQCDELGLPPDAWRGYMSELASLIPGARVAQYPMPSGAAGEDVIYGENEPLPLRLLASRRDEWLASIDRAILRINKALAELETS